MRPPEHADELAHAVTSAFEETDELLLKRRNERRVGRLGRVLGRRRRSRHAGRRRALRHEWQPCKAVAKAGAHLGALRRAFLSAVLGAVLGAVLSAILGAVLSAHGPAQLVCM